MMVTLETIVFFRFSPVNIIFDTKSIQTISSNNGLLFPNDTTPNESEKRRENRKPTFGFFLPSVSAQNFCSPPSAFLFSRCSFSHTRRRTAWEHRSMLHRTYCACQLGNPLSMHACESTDGKRKKLTHLDDLSCSWWSRRRRHSDGFSSVGKTRSHQSSSERDRSSTTVVSHLFGGSSTQSRPGKRKKSPERKIVTSTTTANFDGSSKRKKLAAAALIWSWSIPII